MTALIYSERPEHETSINAWQVVEGVTTKYDWAKGFNIKFINPTLPEASQKAFSIRAFKMLGRKKQQHGI